MSMHTGCRSIGRVWKDLQQAFSNKYTKLTLYIFMTGISITQHNRGAVDLEKARNTKQSLLLQNKLLHSKVQLNQLEVTPEDFNKCLTHPIAPEELFRFLHKHLSEMV